MNVESGPADLSTTYDIARRHIVHDTFDDEVVILNLANGNYYSLDRAGARIWTGLERGLSIGEVVSAISRDYLNPGDGTDMEAATCRLIGELEGEALIVPRAAESASASAAASAPNSGQAGPPPTFEPPVLHKYSDMQALLMLDPIHDIDHTGWPAAKQQPPQT